MCPSESRVILNYDNIQGLENRYRNAVIQPYEPGHSHPKYYMVDTVHMVRRDGMTWEQMYRMAKAAAPLAQRLVVDGLPDNESHDNKTGAVPVSVFTIYPVYAM